MYHNQNQPVGIIGRIPRPKHCLVGPNPTLTVQQAQAIRMRLDMPERVLDLTLFNVAIDRGRNDASKPTLGCDNSAVLRRHAVSDR